MGAKEFQADDIRFEADDGLDAESGDYLAGIIDKLEPAGADGRGPGRAPECAG